MNHTSRLINRIPPRRLLPRPERKGIVEMRAGNQELSFRKSRLVYSPRLFVPRLGWTEEAMIAGSRYLVCLLPLLGLSPGKNLLLLSAFNNRFASKELQVARLTYCGFVEKTSVGFIPDASEGTYSPKH
ncbi:hypothetical protein DY000_02015268 [Brassica cretica]|uniref:Uncharacterized protein n=1 Tax=Brassica cretica TaxID=69181 RepID=A0ABQ7CUB0_BRACR|nr:hypothetical protein DY000_02015268 [Brassica cretica]